MLSNIEMSLEVKFSNDGLQLMPQILLKSDLKEVKAVLRSIIAANTVEELRQTL